MNPSTVPGSPTIYQPTHKSIPLITDSDEMPKASGLVKVQNQVQRKTHRKCQIIFNRTSVLSHNLKIILRFKNFLTRNCLS